MGERMLETDVLVVGGGGAGFRAAIGARESGARALLLSKGPLARCGATPMAGADFTLDGRSLSRLGFPGAPGDTEEKFFNDIVTQGYYLNNQKLVEQYIRSAPARLKELLDWGLKVNFSEERAIFTSGIGLMDVLLNQARSAGVDMLEDTLLLDLLVEDGRIAGGLGLDVRTGDFLEIKAKAAVMATGGWHKAFWPNTGMRDLSGDGMAMAHRAGAELGNMEFITFCCNILLYPPVWRGSLATYILGLLSGGELTNSAGEAFLQKYDPYTVEKGTTMEWNKGFISYATSKEVREGKGSPNGGVYYGLGRVRWEDFENRLREDDLPQLEIQGDGFGGIGQDPEERRNGRGRAGGRVLRRRRGSQREIRNEGPGPVCGGRMYSGPVWLKPGLLGNNRNARPWGRSGEERRGLCAGGENTSSPAALLPTSPGKGADAPGQEGRLETRPG